MTWHKGESGNPAGKPPGTKNKRTLAREAVVGEGNGVGELPVEFLLAIMRNSREGIERRMEAAKAVAPYIHPRLTAIEHSGAVGRPEHELATEIAALPLELQHALADYARRARRIDPAGDGEVPALVVEHEL